VTTILLEITFGIAAQQERQCQFDNNIDQSPANIGKMSLIAQTSINLVKDIIERK